MPKRIVKKPKRIQGSIPGVRLHKRNKALIKELTAFPRIYSLSLRKAVGLIRRTEKPKTSQRMERILSIIGKTRHKAVQISFLRKEFFKGQKRTPTKERLFEEALFGLKAMGIIEKKAGIVFVLKPFAVKAFKIKN